MSSPTARSEGLRLELPYPPTINHYWGVNGNRRFVRKRGLEFREMVALEARDRQTVEGSVEVRIEVHPPDRRKRDLDNVQKATLDALQHAGVFADDNQVDRIVTERCNVVEDGALVVTVREIGDG